jgi:porphobilinogen synthase
LFGIPDHKGPLGHSADDVNGVVQQALRAIRDGGFNLTLVADACFCEYTDHGHCGVLAADRRDVVDNDATLERLQSLVVSLAEAGADAVAPSGMMDGTVAAVREALDRNNFSAVPILMYSAKYASAFYGPFREAAQGAPSFGDRRAYQMDPRNGREALVEAELDVAQGADIVMVKPALSYLDIIRRLRDRLNVPIAAYNVSGEYAMVKAASAAGMLDEQATVTEILTSIRRAGADAIVTYHAADFARWQQNS